MAAYDGETAVVGRDIAPFELFACEQLTEQIRSVSAAKDEVTVAHGKVLDCLTLVEALRDAATTIRFNSKWFTQTALTTLLETALAAAAPLQSSADLYAVLNLIETVGTYSLVPPQCLQQTVAFIAQTYYNATRANKTQRLAEKAWKTLRHILESHLGDQCMSALVEVISCEDDTRLESRAGYTQVAGALMIISDKILNEEGDAARPLPTPSLTIFLSALQSVCVTDNGHLREIVMDINIQTLAHDDAVTALDEQMGWKQFLEMAETCIGQSADSTAVASFVKGLSAYTGHLESPELATLARLYVVADLPLTDVLSNAILEPWSLQMSEREWTSGFGPLLNKFSGSDNYIRELRALLDSSIEYLAHTTQLHPISKYAETVQDCVERPATTAQATVVLVEAMVKTFMRCVRSRSHSYEKTALFCTMCAVSRTCIEAARFLFEFRADVESSVYIEVELQDPFRAVDGSPSWIKVLYDVSSLPWERWEEAVVAAIERPSEWEVFHYFLTYLTPLLANHTILGRRIGTVQRLKGTVCRMLESGKYPEPPPATGLMKPYVATYLIQILTAILSYHRHLTKKDLLQVVSIFVNTAGSRDHTVSIHCVHALTICCYELPDLMSSYMHDVIDKMSKMVTQRYLAIHVLQFLAGLSRLPDLFRNFQRHDYKKVFGVCINYLQSIRGTHALLDRQQTPTSQRSSMKSGDSADALPQYVYALAHHVLTFWYLTLKREARQELKQYITTSLRYPAYDGREVIEDQGLVTIDLMDRVDVEDSTTSTSKGFDRVDGRILVQHRLVGLLLTTSETALRTGKTIVTIRRASGTVKSTINGADIVTISVDSDRNEYMPVFPYDLNGRTYGSILIPRNESVLGSETTLSLPEDETVTRALQLFDRTSALDSHKAGVIYVGEGQTTEDEIFQNVMGSPDYVQFVEGLGTLMRLKHATFNTQGLDRENDADGLHAIVWHNEVTEVVFHVTTLMPNDEDVSLNTANKKRHIGNDFVNIVFNNSGAPFNFNTFPSQFNSIYIVITPSARTSFLQTRTQKKTTEKKTRFYSVKVLTRPGYPSISSAAEEKVVSGASLPGYVRNLALNDCVFSLMWSHRDEAGEYPSSWRSRLQQLRRFRERYEGKRA